MLAHSHAPGSRCSRLYEGCHDDGDDGGDDDDDDDDGDDDFGHEYYDENDFFDIEPRPSGKL